MATPTAEQLAEILSRHTAWLCGEQSDHAHRASLSNADLSNADLRDAVLSNADLRDADLRNADLRNADLRDAVLSNADLRNADLRNASLRDAVLSNADLRNADLRNASLRDAVLSNADLRDAVLPHFQIPQTGSLIVYKRVRSGVARLLIPSTARRTASLIGRKCRAEYADVLSVPGKVSPSLRHSKFFYTEGERVVADDYDDDPRVECSHGIHVFLTEREAEEWMQ